MSKTHRGGRPKGYMDDWSPRPDTIDIVDNVKTIISNSRFATMTVRFIFYRLVANYGYPKTERAYKNLAEVLVKARRAQMIPFHAISDSGTETAGGGGYRSRTSFLRTLKSYGSYYRLDRQLEQPYELELWSEDAGSLVMLEQIVSDYDVTCYSTGGFSSVTVTHEVADRIVARDRPTVILHVGDYDPSGVSIFESMCQDIGSFVASKIGGYYRADTGAVEDENRNEKFVPRRVALTEEQVEEFDLETAPPKATDSRSINWVGETTQVQAMTEDLMEQVLTEAVDEFYDHDIKEQIEEREEEDRELMGTKISDAIEKIIEEIG